MSKKSSTPVFAKILDFVLPFVPDLAKKQLIKGAELVTLETDAYVKSGNYNVHKVDHLARTSAQMSRRVDEGHEGEWAFTYSTMLGRRVDDIIGVALHFFATLIHPSEPRSDINPKTGEPKMNHKKKERDAWVASLGFTHEQDALALKFKRVLWSERFDPLRAELEALIPERLEGTDIKVSTKGSFMIISPPKHRAKALRFPATLQTGKPDSIAYDVADLVTFIKDGWDFQRKEGLADTPLAQFYEGQVLTYLEAEKARAELDAAAETEEADTAAA